METNNMPHFSFRMTSTTPLSSCIVTASGPLLVPGGVAVLVVVVAAVVVLLLLLLLVAVDPVDPVLPGGIAPSMMLSRSVPLLCMAYRLAATVPWVRRVATGMGGCDA